MKANEFVKRFGLERAKQFVNADHTAHALVFATTGVSFIDLNRLVESYKIVNFYGGIQNAKEIVKISVRSGYRPSSLSDINQAIADV